MISRRIFIRTLSLAAAGLAAGASSLVSASTKDFSINGFLPHEKKIFMSLSAYIKEITGSNEASIYSDTQGNISHYFEHHRLADLKLHITKLNKEIYADIMTGTGNTNIVSLSEMDAKLLEFRKSLLGRKADYFFQAVYKKSSLSDFFYTSGNKIRINNHQGIFDELNSSDNYKLIKVPGPLGNTVIKINCGKIQVIQASCKHKYCMNMRYNSSGIIACVPNKVIIRSIV